MGIAGAALAVIFCLLTVVLSVYLKEPGVLFILLFLVPVLIWWLYERRYGFDRFAAFELSDTEIQTTSTSPKMRRRFSWTEVSVIQSTRLEGTRTTLPVDCYVFVKGRENALIQCQAMETFGNIFSNPNRIAILKNEKTEPFVAAAAERYDIPREICYIPIRNKYE